MNFLLAYANFIVFGVGVYFVQDAVASCWHYHGKETWGNHAFRLSRLVQAIILIVIGVNLGS